MIAYSVQLPVFQGPLDLLLQLIERAELEITKVALSEVTDQYLAHLERIQERSLEDLANFLVVAARLLQIKSEALLPRPPEREPEEEDPGEALARQLVEYRKFKQLAQFLGDRQSAGYRSYIRLASAPIPDLNLDLAGVNLTDLRQAMLEALASMPKPSALGKVVTPQRTRIRDKIRVIVEAIRKNGSTTFRSLLGAVRNRVEIVVSFLAMLELVKSGQIIAEQKQTFGEIELAPGKAWKNDQDLELELEFEE